MLGKASKSHRVDSSKQRHRKASLALQSVRVCVEPEDTRVGKVVGNEVGKLGLAMLE